MNKDDKKDGLFKRLKNIENKNEELLKTTKNKTKNIKEAKVLIKESRIIQKNVDDRKLKIIGGNNVAYNFSNFKTFNDLFEDLFSKKLLTDDAEMKQNEFEANFNALSGYYPRNQKYIETKSKLLVNTENFHKERKKLLKILKKEYFC